MRMTKETAGINQRVERIEHLLQGGLRGFFEQRRQAGPGPDLVHHPRELVDETNDIYELILNVRLENIPDRNQWQCSKYTKTSHSVSNMLFYENTIYVQMLNEAREIKIDFFINICYFLCNL